jgi:hypothetical protein
MYNAHPKLFWHSFWLHLIYLSYLSNVYCVCSFFTNLDLLYRKRALSIQKLYCNVYHACSFFMNLDLFCIDNARIIYKKIRYIFYASKNCEINEKYALINNLNNVMIINNYIIPTFSIFFTHSNNIWKVTT